MTEKRVVVAQSAQELAGLVAEKFIIRVRKTVRRESVAHVVLTGGTIAREVHRAVAHHPDRDSVDWAGVHFWWGDDRFVPGGHSDRNEQQATDDMLVALPLNGENIHRVASSDSGVSLEQAASAYAAELSRWAAPGERCPVFTLAFVGVGPDGHVLSVFPGTPVASMAEQAVVGVDNCPKPPPERVTMNVPLLNEAKRVWVVAAGSDKAAAIGLALAGAQVHEVPAAGVRGSHSTKVFIDAALAAGVPNELVERQRFWSADDERADYIPNSLR